LLVDGVNLGSQEHARGIEQISKAVILMEQVTQGAAANAEEGASASEELSAHAQALNSIVLRLRDLAGSESHHEGDGDHKIVRVARTTASRPARGSVPAAAANKVDRHSFPLEDDFTEI
jgi:methyl-accepting chemotaxis protein